MQWYPLSVLQLPCARYWLPPSSGAARGEGNTIVPLRRQNFTVISRGFGGGRSPQLW